MAQALLAAPTIPEQREQIRRELAAACGEEFEGFYSAAVEAIVEAVLSGIHTRGDSGIAPQVFRSTLGYVRRGVDGAGNPITSRRAYLIGSLGKEARRRGQRLFRSHGRPGVREESSR